MIYSKEVDNMCVVAKGPKKNAYFADQIRFLEKLIINNKTNK